MAVHLYGVVRADTDLPDVKGRLEQPLRLVDKDDLAVIVSDVDEQARAGARDLMAHARVLEECVRYATVVPMQFGILLPDDAMVRREVLVRDCESLTELLDRFDGLVQLTVRVTAEEEPALREVLARDPALLGLRTPAMSAAGDSPSAAQLQLGQAVVSALEALAAERAGQVTAELDPHAVSVRVVDPQSVNEVLNAAYLVKRDAMEQFDAAVARVREQHADTLQVRYVGPQPPYSYVDATAGREAR